MHHFALRPLDVCGHWMFTLLAGKAKQRVYTCVSGPRTVVLWDSLHRKLSHACAPQKHKASSSAEADDISDLPKRKPAGKKAAAAKAEGRMPKATKAGASSKVILSSALQCEGLAWLQVMVSCRPCCHTACQHCRLLNMLAITLIMWKQQQTRCLVQAALPACANKTNAPAVTAARKAAGRARQRAAKVLNTTMNMSHVVCFRT
jgi:hypothetical protein